MQAERRGGLVEEGLMAEYLLFATERYALPILRPLAETLQAAGHGVSALLVRGAAGSALPAPVRAVDVRAAVALKPRAVFSAANDVPSFVSGAKVQLFHGFNVEKRADTRGHFRVRGLFDERQLDFERRIKRSRLAVESIDVRAHRALTVVGKCCSVKETAGARSGSE